MGIIDLQYHFLQILLTKIKNSPKSKMEHEKDMMNTWVIIDRLQYKNVSA